MDKKFVCILCKKKLKSKYNLKIHYSLIHHLETAEQTRKISCGEIDCNSMFNSVQALSNHLTSVHDIVIDSEELIFQTFQEFLAWKKALEQKECCLFIKKRGMKKINDIDQEKIRMYYYCNRSGFSTAKADERKRQMKSQGTCKLNNYCTSMMYATICDGLVEVHYTKTHYNHEMNLVHIPPSVRDANAHVLSPSSYKYSFQEKKNILLDDLHKQIAKVAALEDSDSACAFISTIRHHIISASAAMDAYSSCSLSSISNVLESPNKEQKYFPTNIKKELNVRPSLKFSDPDEEMNHLDDVMPSSSTTSPLVIRIKEPAGVSSEYQYLNQNVFVSKKEDLSKEWLNQDEHHMQIIAE